MNTNSKRLGIYLAIMLVMTAIATALRTVACIMHLDYESGFFSNKTLIAIANVIVTITVIGMFSYLFIAPRIKLRASFATSSTYVPTGLLGVATAFLGARIISHVSVTGRYPVLSVEVLTLQSPATLIGIITAILAFISIAHHFFNAFITESKTEIRAYFAIATIAFLSLYAILIYLDTSISINESIKVLRLTAFLVSALFFLYEARISLGREMWRIYSAFGLCASMLCAYASIPAITTYYVNGALVSSSGYRSLVSIEEYLLLFTMFVFITARLCITIMAKEEKENEFIKALATYATEREEKVKESIGRYQQIFAAKQLSIFDLYGGGDIDIIPDENEETEPEVNEDEQNKIPTISDDAIYEAIFGKMPKKNEENIEEIPEPEDERDPEEIAEELLNSLENAINSTVDNKKENDL